MMHSSRWVFDSVTLLCLMSTLGVPCWAELQIIRSPQNRTIMLNHRLKYKCVVSGNGADEVVVKWYHNDTEMSRRGKNYRIYSEDDNTVTLRFSQVKVINRGKYHCRVQNKFKEVVESPPAYLIVHAEAEIIDKTTTERPRHQVVGSVLFLSCEAAGIPPPTIEWRKNGVVIPDSPREVEHSTSQVSIKSQLRLVVSEPAIYTCTALNSPIGGPANDSAIIHVKIVEPQVQADVSNQPAQYCAPYKGTICKDYLRGRMVVHSIHNSTSEYDPEAMLAAHLQRVAELELFSEQMGEGFCEEPAKRLLCHLNFPDCHNETNHPVPVCQESCIAVKSLFCFVELAKMDRLKTDGKSPSSISLFNLPDCMVLPSKWNVSHTCTESNHHDFSKSKVRDDCYVEKGRWYNGTINTTKSGLTCQAWDETYPQKHDRSPLIFPELWDSSNYCRNPGGEEARPWCYTTDKLRRWEFCDIDPCDLKGDASTGSSQPSDGDRARAEAEEEEDLSLLTIILVCASVVMVFIIAFLCILVRYCRHARYIATPQDDLDTDVENLPINSAYHQMKSNRLNPKLETLEFPRNDIVFIEDIGQGAFGRVFKARIVCSNGNSHITGGKLSGSKHSLSCGKNCKNKNPFSSKGDLRHIDISTKSCDSRLLAEHVPMSCDHEKDDVSSKYSEGQLIAIKMLKEDASDTVQADFEREASLMVEFDHTNIVRLLGVCTVGKPMCLLFEYMSKGDLNEFLRLCSPDQCLRRSNEGSNPSLEEVGSIDLVDQLHMARQIASGMVYLSERGYVHRDLATRNCLVGNNLTVKISDFGLARSVHSMDYYQGSDKDAIPIRWMPPEAILYNKFSSQSDIWSFGVLLWEIFSFARQPYYGMTHEEVVNYLRAGNVLDSPDNVPSAAYELMKSCWHRKPSSRPSFVFLQKSLGVMHDEMCKHRRQNTLNV